MTNASDFKVGDRIKLTGPEWANFYEDGKHAMPARDSIHTITHFAEGPEGDLLPHFLWSSKAWWVEGEGEDFAAEPFHDEPTRSGYQENEDGTLTELGAWKREKHIAHINEQDAIIRRRNTQISRQVAEITDLNATIERQKAQLVEYAAQIEELKSTAPKWVEFGKEFYKNGLGVAMALSNALALKEPDDTHTLDKAASQAGLDANGAVEALELGARLLALGLTPEEIEDARRRLLVPTGWDANESLKSKYVEGAAIRALQKRIGEANAEKGFHEEGDSLRSRIAGYDVPGYLRNYATARLALITTEVAEAIEEIRNGRGYTETWYSAEADGVTYGWYAGSQPEAVADAVGKPEGVPSELADIVIRALDFAHEFGIDLASMIDEKLTYNATRPRKHGKEF